MIKIIVTSTNNLVRVLLRVGLETGGLGVGYSGNTTYLLLVLECLRSQRSEEFTTAVPLVLVGAITNKCNKQADFGAYFY